MYTPNNKGVLEVFLCGRFLYLITSEEKLLQVLAIVM